jgi:hypothetical protein
LLVFCLYIGLANGERLQGCLVFLTFDDHALVTVSCLDCHKVIEQVAP